MAALHAAQQNELLLPRSLFTELYDRFHNCFQYDSANEYNFRVISLPPVVERYTRALFIDADLVGVWDTNWDRILSFFTSLEDLSAAVFCTYAVNYGKMPMESLKPIIQCVLDLPPIEVNKVCLSFHYQFLKATDAAAFLDLYSADERERLFVSLVKRLSPQKSLTLQEDLMIHCLYSSCINTGIIEPLEKEALKKELDSEASAGIMRKATLLRFIRLLPDIANCALLSGSDEQDRLSLYLSKMDFWKWDDAILMIWGGRWARLSKNEPEFSSCASSLVKLLNQLASSCEEWSGSVIVRLRAITNLYNTLQFDGKCDEEVTRAMFHWLLVISLGAWNCSGNADHNDQTEMKDKLLKSLFPKPLLRIDHLIDLLRTCCAFIEWKLLVGLPLLVMEHILEQFKYLLEKSYEPVVLDSLDSLFRHFIEQDPLRVDSVYPMTRADQLRTLASLINFAHTEQFHSKHWEKMLSDWRVLVIDKLLEASNANPDIVMDSNNPKLLIDSWDLRDVQWIFKVDGFIDSWDIRDVLWMFEEQIPFGGPLNLQKLLRHLDSALDRREGSIDLCDATWLFRYASDDPFPSPCLISEAGSFEPNADSDGESQPTDSRKLCRFM